MNRRGLLTATGAMIAACASLPASASDSGGATTPADETGGGGRLPLDVLRDPKFNVQAMARLTSSLEPGATGRVHYSGKSFALDGAGRTVPLFGIEGMGSLRALPQPGGAIRFLFAEFAVYTDLASGEPLKEFRNPLSGEAVEVWHQRNGPVNYAIDPAQAAFGSFERAAARDRGFLLPWKVSGETASFTIDTVSERKNALDPATWPRESTGSEIQLSEHGQYFVRLDALLDPAIRSLEFDASLQSLKPWHPWMLMGQAPGKLFTVMTARKITRLEDLPAPVAGLARRELAGFLEAPSGWTGQYVTANQLYMKDRKPKGTP